MKSASLLLALLPSFSGAAPITGTVSLLDGSPLSRAVVRVGTDSVQTSAAGSFTVARTTGVGGAPGAVHRVSKNLSVHQGRISLGWNGSDILGRGAVVSARDRGPLPRAMSSTDTLSVYWKGKRLVVLPLPTDTGTLTFRIDTAWKDDAGIPWNGRVAYGSLADSRDGRTYRTVRIGGRTWMAENLAFDAPGARRYDGNADSASKLGLLYGWSLAMGLDGVCDSTVCSPGSAIRRGICPSGWHLPDTAAWDSLYSTAGGSATGGRVLKSVAGWYLYSYLENTGSGQDELGFRALPAGYWDGDDMDADFVGAWWSIGEFSAKLGESAYINTIGFGAQRSVDSKGTSHSVRCIGD